MLAAATLMLDSGKSFAGSQSKSVDRPYVNVETIEAAMKDGRTIFVNWKSKWCGTCNIQTKVLDAILMDEPTIAEQVLFVSLDWDDYRNDKFTRQLNIPRRSTLVLFKGTEEIGRLVAAIKRSEIENLIRAAL
tara:strand:+ start:110 stop:508 length:399 start_codon:yes stop_codon:yes gene_type:complete